MVSSFKKCNSIRKLGATLAVVSAGYGVPAGAVDVSSWDELKNNKNQSVVFTKDIGVGSGSVTFTGAELDGGGFSLNGHSDGVNLNIGGNTVDLINLGAYVTGSGTVVYLDADGNEQHLEISGSVNGFGSKGAVVSTADELNVENSVFQNNQTTIFNKGGGAIYASDNETALVKINDSVFVGNTSSWKGGAVYYEHINVVDAPSVGDITIDGSYFIGNQSNDWDDGGAVVANDVYKMTIKNSKFHGNSSQWGGGAAYFNANISKIDNVVFSNNTSWFSGGGVTLAYSDVASTPGTISIENSKFIRNKTTKYWEEIGVEVGGGGLQIDNPLKNVQTKIVNTDFIENEGTRGGGLYLEQPEGEVYIEGGLFSGNKVAYCDSYTSSYGLGGGLYINNPLGNVYVLDANFTGNKAEVGGGVVLSGGTAPVTFVDSSFSKNEVTLDGGAIYAEYSVFNVFADKKDVVFSENVSDSDSADYNGGGALSLTASEATLNATEGKKIVFNDTIGSWYEDGESVIININKPDLSYKDIDGAEVAMGNSGEVQFNNRVGDADHNVNFNLSGGRLSIGQNLEQNKRIDNPDGYINGNNLSVLADAELYTVNGVIGEVKLNRLNVGATLWAMVDAALAGDNPTMDRLNANEVVGDKLVKLKYVNVISDADGESATARFTEENRKDKVGLAEDVEVVAPLYKYKVTYNNDGTFTFTKTSDEAGGGESDNPPVTPAPKPVASDYNPALYERRVSLASIANIQTNINNMLFSDFSVGERIPVGVYGLSSGDELSPVRTWLRLSSYKDRFDFENFAAVKQDLSMITAGVSKDLNNFDKIKAKVNFYVGLSDGTSKYDDIKIDERGGYVGAALHFLSGNLFYDANVTGGFLRSKAHNMYGRDSYTDYWASVGGNIGYIFGINDKVSLEPRTHVGYTYANTGNYTNAAGTSVHVKDVHFVEVVPEVRVNYQLSDKWKGFATTRYVFGDWNGGDIRADYINLPGISYEDYAEAGLGVSSNHDSYDVEALVYRRFGNHDGWNGYLNLKYYF